jgi:TnpA family transposase
VTERVFGLSHLIGFRFAPRIRDIPTAGFVSPTAMPIMSGSGR